MLSHLTNLRPFLASFAFAQFEFQLRETAPCTDETGVWGPAAWLAMIAGPLTSYENWGQCLNPQCLVSKTGTIREHTSWDFVTG